MRTKVFFRAAYVTVTIALAAGTMWGQVFQGSVRGLVQDPGGAVIAGANVELIDQATNLVRSTVSNAQGEYSFASVDPATYTVRASAAGFKVLERKDVVVETAETQTLDMKLEVGAVSESIVVNEEVPLIETSNASNGEVIDNQKLEDLPNLGRNTFLLSKLANTVIPSGDPRWNRFEDQTGSSQVSIGGGPIRGNNYTMDGIPITDSTNRAVIIPMQEAVQEMKMQTGTYDATMGRTGGGVFNTVLKVGTNDLHGDILGYLRDPTMDANLFFNNAAGEPRPPATTYTWAGSLGGPVVIPKIYNGKNKTFFLLASEAYQDHQPLSTEYSMPTAAEAQGNFSQAIQSNGQPWLIYDPTTGVSCTATGVTCPKNDLVVRTPFPGNIIPQSRFDPIGAAFMSYVPLEQTSSQVLGAANFNGTDSPLDRAQEWSGKLEHELTSWFRITGSFMWYKSREPYGNLIGTLPGQSSAYLLYRWVDATAVNAIMTPNPTTVITVRYGFNRFPNITTGVSYPQHFQESSLGFSPTFLSELQANYFPTVTISPGLGAEASTTLGDGLSYTNYYSKNLLGSVSKFIGRHNLSMGADYRQINTGYNISPGAGSFTFSEGATAGWTGQYLGTQGNSGSGYADALLGLITSASVTTAIPLNNYVRYYSGYFQDDIRVNNRLTVNVGLRYEYETGDNEENNNLVSSFNLYAVNPITALSGVQANGVPVFAGVEGGKTSTGNPSKFHFGPRIGAAYQLNNKTTVRGGFGVFYAPTVFSTSDGNLGFTQANTAIPSNNNYLTPAVSLSNVFPSGLIQPTGSTLGGLTGIGQSVSFIDPNRAGGGTVYQFSADVQREIRYGVAVEVGYIGSRSNGLGTGSLGASASGLNLDQLPLSDNAMGSALGAVVTNPFYGHGGANTFANPTINEYYLLSPYPQYTGVSTSGNLAVAKFDSMVAKATKRLSHGLTFLTTLTWEKNQDDTFGGGSGNSLLGGVGGGGATGGIQNVYANIKQTEWGESASDTPLRWTATFTYALPFGKGQRFLHNNSVLNYIVGGWQLNDTTIVQSGYPTYIQQTNGNTFLNTANQRPNATGISPATPGSLEQRLGDYYNAAAFSLAPAYTFGNLGRNISLRGPGLSNFDASLFKSFRIKERFQGQFRAEALNAMNTPLFASPHTTYSVNSSSFGTITYQANIPRNLQLGIRLSF
jgi:trimeric autotransporter adhesin